MAWIENDEGDVLLVRQTAGQKLWTLPGERSSETNRLSVP